MSERPEERLVRFVKACDDAEVYDLTTSSQGSLRPPDIDFAGQRGARVDWNSPGPLLPIARAMAEVTGAARLWRHRLASGRDGTSELLAALQALDSLGEEG